MEERVTVALDVMGGDKAPEQILKGASLYLKNNPESVFFRLFGCKESIENCLKGDILLQSSEIIHTEDVVSPNDKPSFAVRGRKSSSMYKAVFDVKEGKSTCVVSAGNTGAFMGISKILLGMLQNIYRPAIVTTLPSKKGEVVVLDLGANLECSSEVLYQLAFMGSAFSRAALRVMNPTVGILNIGIEENKGTDAVKEAFKLLDEKGDTAFLEFRGYVEPADMLKGEVDVVVTDGFTGNIMLKTAESIYHLVKDGVVQASKRSILSRIAGFLLSRDLKKSLSNFNPDLRNGAMLVGLNGIAVKAHGSSDATAFANAIKVAVNLVNNNLNAQIMESIYMD